MYIGFILLVACILYHTLDTQKSMKPLFGHLYFVSKYRLRPWARLQPTIQKDMGATEEFKGALGSKLM